MNYEVNVMMGPVCFNRVHHKLFEFLAETFESLIIVLQVAARPAKLKPMVHFISETWYQLLFYHPSVLSKIRYILTGMSARLSHATAKMFHQIDSYRLLAIDFFSINDLAQTSVKIFGAATKFPQEGLVVNTSAAEVDLLVRKLQPFG